MTKIAKFLVFIALVFMVMSVERAMKAWQLRLQKDEQYNANHVTQTQPVMVERETIDILNVPWKNPRIAPKGKSWTFDLFTSPTILREGTEFKATFPWMEKSQSTINFEIIELSKKVYPLQFSGYFSRPIVNGKKSEDHSFSFILSDVQNRESFQVQLGQVVEYYGVEILSFIEKGSNGEIQGYPQLKVMDHNIGREVILTPEKRYYDQLFVIRLRSKVDKSEFFLSHIDEEFSVGGDQYVLKKIDEEKKRLEFLQKMGKDSCVFSLEIVSENISSTIETI
ncbi:MAG: hypothetical protein LBH08_00475 [Puniceicoccales bacterium]|jgi:hypothetical protein|nr:hypothetical protein [Puniceicoccales bacterium]